MATKDKDKTAEATFSHRANTKRKARFDEDETNVVGSLYLTLENWEALGSPEKIRMVVTPA